MKTKFISTILLAFALVASSFFTPGGEESIAIGTKAPLSSVKLKGIDGADHSLESLKKENGLLVIFSCNTCPFVVGRGTDTEGWEGRYAGLKQQCDVANIGMVLINSNEAKRDNGDSMDDMKSHAADVGIDHIAYVLDKNHKVADAFGAKTTPHVFLFDSKMVLSYKGAIDDNVDKASDVREHWVINALASCSAGKPIEPQETRATGCSIKRVK